MGRKIEFTHYLHDDASANENVEFFKSRMNSVTGGLIIPDEVTPEEATAAVTKLFDERPFYEIGIRVSLDIDTGEITYLKIE